MDLDSSTSSNAHSARAFVQVTSWSWTIYVPITLRQSPMPLQLAEHQLGTCPPYSPDFNPIELLWAFIKRKLRRLKLRQVEPLLAAIAKLLRRVPQSHFSRWFDNCGYLQRN